MLNLLHRSGFLGSVLVLGICQVQILSFQVSGKHQQIVPPGQLSNSLLDDLRIRPGLGKGAHVKEIGAGEALHGWKGITQDLRQPLDHLGAPAFPALTLQDPPADLPVEQHQLAVDAAGSPLLGGVDAGLELGEPGAVVDGQGDDLSHGHHQPRRASNPSSNDA